MNNTQFVIPMILVVYLLIVIGAFVLLRKNSKRAWILVLISLAATFLIAQTVSRVIGGVGIYHFTICNPDGSQDYTGYYLKLILNLILVISGALLPSIMAYKFIKKQHVSNLIFLLGLISMFGLGIMGTDGFTAPRACIKIPYSIII